MLDKLFPSIGFVVVCTSIIAGYLWHGGNLHLLYQPTEVLIIGGSGIGAFIISNDVHSVKAVLLAVKNAIFSTALGEKDYLDTLQLMNDILKKFKKEGGLKLEADMDNPSESTLFKKYPDVLKIEDSVTFLSDSFRLIISGQHIPPHELDPLLDSEIDFFHEEEAKKAHHLNALAEAFPALGIVAAVLGVIITMTKISEPAEVLGHSIGAALVGTFLGVLLCYGFVGPLAKKIELKADRGKEHMHMIKVVVICFVSEMSPQMSVEFGRRATPLDIRPSFFELEELLKQNK